MSANPPVVTSRDRAIVGGLLLVLVAVAAGIVVPGGAPAPTTGGGPTASASAPTASGAPARALRLGLVGAPSAVNPLLATTRADHELVGLVFSGLVRLGPGQALEPDLASDWRTTDDGRTWTFTLRPDARWHDGRPVTARDVAFTVAVLRDPAYTGPAGASWRDVTATEVDPSTVRFDLQAPIGGFLQAATQPLLPAHLLDDVPLADLPAHGFNRAPVGTGPYRLTSLDERRALLEPASRRRAEPPPDPSATPLPAASSGTPTAGPSGPSASGPSGPAASGASGPSAAGSLRPSPEPPSAGPTPAPSVSATASATASTPTAPDDATPPSMEVRFYPDSASLVSAFGEESLDAASGLSPEEAVQLASTPETRLLRYPTSTLTAVLFNLRPSRPEFRDARVRSALLRAIDRAALIADAWAGQANLATAPIPSVSWAFDPGASRRVAFDRAAARAALLAAGWREEGDGLAAPKRNGRFAFELISPDVATNPGTFLAAADIAAGWTALGLDVTPRALPPEELVSEHLRTGAFAAAVVDINVGLDPDLYPLLGSTQATSVGLNVSGLVDRELDALLVAARAPGTDAARRAAYRALQVRLAERHYLLPIAFRDELVVARDTLVGPRIRQIGGVGDRFWDVLSWRLAADR